MNQKMRRLFGVLFLLLAIGALLLYRPVLRAVGVDLDHTVPEWADFLTPVQYETFVGDVRAFFLAKGLAVSLREGKVYPENGEEYGLRYIAQKCHGAPRAAWAGLIGQYFEPLLAQKKGEVSGEEKGRR